MQAHNTADIQVMFLTFGKPRTRESGLVIMKCLMQPFPMFTSARYPSTAFIASSAHSGKFLFYQSIFVHFEKVFSSSSKLRLKILCFVPISGTSIEPELSRLSPRTAVVYGIDSPVGFSF